MVSDAHGSSDSPVEHVKVGGIQRRIRNAAETRLIDEKLSGVADSFLAGQDVGLCANARTEPSAHSIDIGANVHLAAASSEVRHRVLARDFGNISELDQCQRSIFETDCQSGATALATKADDTSFPDGEFTTGSLHKFWHRAGWLVLLLLFQSTSSVILEHFETLIKQHPVVIYFLTMLVGAGGNAGGQSTVLVVRRLALLSTRQGGGNQPVSANGDRDFSARKIIGTEVSKGARLAIVLFVASFVRCIVFKVRGVEALAICLSMLAIVFFSTLVGAALPLLLSRLQVDPAHAGAAIQVVMDISGVTLTCIVSCLVLGVPLHGSPSVSDKIFGGAGIQRDGSRHSLSSLGVHVNNSHMRSHYPP